MQLDRMDIIHIFKSAFIVGTPYMVSEISILQADAIYGVPTNAAYTLLYEHPTSIANMTFTVVGAICGHPQEPQ